MSDDYVVYSFDQKAWRRADGGYSTRVSEAGRYPADEADAICDVANRDGVCHLIGVTYDDAALLDEVAYQSDTNRRRALMRIVRDQTWRH